VSGGGVVQERECGRVPCPAYWEEAGWTPCSVSCGIGMATHGIYCMFRANFGFSGKKYYAGVEINGTDLASVGVLGVC